MLSGRVKQRNSIKSRFCILSSLFYSLFLLFAFFNNQNDNHSNKSNQHRRHNNDCNNILRVSDNGGGHRNTFVGCITKSYIRIRSSVQIDNETAFICFYIVEKNDAIIIAFIKYRRFISVKLCNPAENPFVNIRRSSCRGAERCLVTGCMNQSRHSFRFGLILVGIRKCLGLF